MNSESLNLFNPAIVFSYASISVVPNDKRIFSTSWFGVYRSDDLGETWIQCANGLPINFPFREIKISLTNSDYIITGDEINRVFLSTDRGETWTQANDLPLQNESWGIEDLEFHPDDPNHIYVSCYFSGLFESTDFGQSWVCLNNDLPVENPERVIISGIAINPQNPLNMFVSSNHMGIYQSHDGGQSWESFNAGLDTTSSVGLIYFVPGDTTNLYFASHNRSVWTITRTPTVIEEDNTHLPLEISLSSYPNPFNARTNIVFSLPQSGDVNISIYNITGQLVETIADGFHTAGNHELRWDASNLASGIYFCTLKAKNVSKTASLVLLK